MPTVNERLATLEAIARDNRERIDEIAESINGGAEVPYDRSVRGRQHTMASELHAMNLKAKYLTDLQQERRLVLKGWQQVALLLCAVLTVAASWYSALLH
jgi:hypothetical protein